MLQYLIAQPDDLLYLPRDDLLGGQGGRGGGYAGPYGVGLDLLGSRKGPVLDSSCK